MAKAWEGYIFHNQHGHMDFSGGGHRTYKDIFVIIESPKIEAHGISKMATTYMENNQNIFKMVKSRYL